MKNSIMYWLISLLLLCPPIMGKDKVEFSGFGSAGYLFIDRNPLTDANQPTYYMGKLQADIEFNDEIEAQLDLRGNSVTNNVTFREFSVKFKYMDYLRFKVGNIKRLFGYEYVENREDLLTINRSVVQNNLSIRGFGVRSVSIMAYYNYSKKRPDFPYTYSVSIFKDNSLGSGINLHGLYHINKFKFGFSYLFQNFSGSFPISAHGINLEGGFTGDHSVVNIGLVYIQDPLLGQEILAANNARKEEGVSDYEQDEKVYSAGIVLSGGLAFDTDAKIIKTIEPVALFSLFFPKSEEIKNHVIQGLLGVNFYFTKKVRIRFNADLRLTKSEYDDSGKYATNDSRAIAEVQVRF